MKKLTLICLSIMAMAFMASCRGPQGPAGHDGNANVASSTVRVYSDDWRWVNNCQWMVDIDYPAINSNVFNHGAVLVYMDESGVWTQVPMTYYYVYNDPEAGPINCEASIEVATLSDGGVRLFWTESDFYDGMRPGTHEFKIVAIEASMYDHRSDVDYSNYNAVKAAFQLAD
ncbi:MAG: hypothetical protein J6X40_04850 [Bacteroidales bacterium]|nr:hypothetical protein [Bacteroidales bacterium]